MKPRSGFFAVLLFLADLIDLFLAPVVFSIVGLVLKAPWQYYIIMIGGYFGLVSILELVLRLFFSTPEKKRSTRFFQKFEKIFFTFPEEEEN